jgi:hypothetical protein
VECKFKGLQSLVENPKERRTRGTFRCRWNVNVETCASLYGLSFGFRGSEITACRLGEILQEVRLMD